MSQNTITLDTKTIRLINKYADDFFIAHNIHPLLASRFLSDSNPHTLFIDATDAHALTTLKETMGMIRGGLSAQELSNAVESLRHIATQTADSELKQLLEKESKDDKKVLYSGLALIVLGVIMHKIIPIWPIMILAGAMMTFLFKPLNKKKRFEGYVALFQKRYPHVSLTKSNS